MRFPNSLLWIDSRAGLTVGVTVLVLSGWWSHLYGLPHPLVLAMGIANVVYGTYSLLLERRTERPRVALNLLAMANAAWGLACLGAAYVFAGRATLLGVGVLLFEGVFVGGLAVVEWRYREVLQRRAEGTG